MHALNRLGVLLLAGVLACSAPASAPRPAPHGAAADGLEAEALAALERGLKELGEGRFAEAEELLAALAAEHPSHVPLGIWLQEARLGAARAVPPAQGEGTPDEGLRRAYREQAESRPSVLALLLAARIEDDPVAALLLLDRALALDPDSAWAHYGRAHVLAKRGEFEEARRALEAGLVREPAHLPSRRLSAWLAARSGRLGDAATELESWLADSPADLLVVPARRDEARLDLALLLLHDGRTRQAQRVLGELEDQGVDASRRLSAQAVALETRGRFVEALAAAREAARIAPEAFLPAVQEALILERRLNDDEGARRAWRRVLELSAASEDLGQLLQRWRAQVHLERLERTLLEQDGDEPQP